MMPRFGPMLPNVWPMKHLWSRFEIGRICNRVSTPIISCCRLSPMMNQHQFKYTLHLYNILSLCAGNGLVPSGDKPLHEKMLTAIYIAMTHNTTFYHCVQVLAWHNLNIFIAKCLHCLYSIIMTRDEICHWSCICFCLNSLHWVHSFRSSDAFKHQ